MPKLISRNPANAEIIREFETTPLEDLPKIFDRARTAQMTWRAQTTQVRAEYLIQLRETILNHADEIIYLIAQENGKPRYEAIANEMIPTLDLLTYYSKRSPKLLRDRPIPLTLMKHRKSYLNYWPIGIVAIISPWNYPFFFPFSQIIAAIVTGNAILFKPSELTPCIGLKIQELCNEAGLPPNVLQTLLGDGAVGAAIIKQKPGKIFFTGSVSTGKKIMAASAQHLIPLNLELGGKDAMIVLPDASLDYATSAALWGAFSNSGQVCASTERIFVHERIMGPFLTQLKEKIEILRQGPSSRPENDLGSITSENQKTIYSRQINEAKAKGAEFITGGEFSSNKRFLKPTIITCQQMEELEIYNEETFGPVVTVSSYQSYSEAIEKTNQSKYGLNASIITNNISLGEKIAKQLEVGTVTINEVVYTAGLAETPWGGVKESGFGKTHSEIGLYEFVNIRHIHKPRSRIFIFKSPWWFPYTHFQYISFRQFLEFYRENWINKIRAIPDFLWNFIKFIKEEKRL